MKSPTTVRRYTIHWRDDGWRIFTREMRWVDVLAPEFTRRFRTFAETLRLNQTMSDLSAAGFRDIWVTGESPYAGGEIDIAQEFQRLAAIVRQESPQSQSPNPPPGNDRECKPH